MEFLTCLAILSAEPAKGLDVVVLLIFMCISDMAAVDINPSPSTARPKLLTLREGGMGAACWSRPLRACRRGGTVRVA